MNPTAHPTSRDQGRVIELPNPPFWILLDAQGQAVEGTEDFLRDFWARGMSQSSVESYARDLLRWFRFIWQSSTPWDRVGRDEVRDFVIWMRGATRGEHRGNSLGAARTSVSVSSAQTGFAPNTINHNLSVVSGFYEFHRQNLTGPLRNPVPAQTSMSSRPGARRAPDEALVYGPRADFRQRVPKGNPRSLPDSEYERLFASLTCDRDRAIIAFYVSSAVRPSELVSLTADRVSIGEQAITVRRKGSMDLQRVPASPEAFMWFRLYQESLPVSLRAATGPVWWTRRRPARPMNYESVRAVVRRANAFLGTEWTLHDFRHTAAVRMSEDPKLSISDIQHVLGHVHLATTEQYLRLRQSDVLARVNQHYLARDLASGNDTAEQPSPSRYAEADVNELFGGGHVSR
ncbi:MAG: hypothetical protein EPN91_08890 [Salinibacterium sp.]|nr:MAG: hypothetical protein EPN91_08890 [Salinibacterium sp.]